MNRRQFLRATAALAASGALPLAAQTLSTPAPAEPGAGFDQYFLPILHGFLRNARKTSEDFVVCDYPDGTRLKGCCTPSGKTYVSVARMLPALFDWSQTRRKPVLDDIILSIYRNAFDPNHPDFWGYPPANKANQLYVEASLVARTLWRMAQSKTLDQLTPQQRANIQKWLASCTQVPERKNNHAWFSAINQAARLELSRSYGEFSGDEAWMLEDLKALDALGQNSSDGWYSDSPDQPIYDYYNFWTFANFPLLWGRIIGQRYPDWNEKFRGRIKTFLDRAPHFFAANGSHPLMGRSLIYRWAVLSPLVLGYMEKLWPHSPGLLRRIARKQLEYHWSLGCFDADRGKLRETYSAAGTDVTREPYIDNGHPYWSMLGFEFLSLPKDDPFWTASEEPLPVEKDDFVLRFEGPKFLLSGNKRSGEVRWLQSQNSAKRDAYRDKYSKFAWSSHFGFNATSDKDQVPPDQALIFLDIKTGARATRAAGGVTDARLFDNGVETHWWAQLGDWKFQVISRIKLIGEFEQRSHKITSPDGAIAKLIVVEGGYALPFGEKHKMEMSAPPPEDLKQGWQVLNTPGGTAALLRIVGYNGPITMETRWPNLIHPRAATLTISGIVSSRVITVASLHYASPIPLAKHEILRQGEELVAAWKDW